MAGGSRASRALPYHAGMDAAIARANQQRFLREDGVVMVATIAFGMGIDKPDVRFVAHLDLPKSMEGYYQETGRAGRDGLPADAWMCYGLGDVVTLAQLIAQSRIRRGTQARRARQARCAARLSRDDRLPAPAPARLFRRDDCDARTAAIATTASIRPRPGTRAMVAQKALSCVYRTGQRFGVAHLTCRVARRGRRARRAPSARSAHDVRHRRGARQAAVARRVPPARRARVCSRPTRKATARCA